MLLALLAYLGGVLTIFSPCILPVLPFVLARADRPFVRSGLPMLAGMALTFAAIATLAAVGGGWAVRANEVGRWIALLLLAGFGVALLVPAVSERLARPLVALGDRLSARAGQGEARGELGASLLLGAATGLLWAPCAGPILGLIFTTAALNGANAGTTGLLLAYALGAATSLGLAMLAGRGLFARLKRSLRATELIKRVLGAFVLLGAAAIALGLDTRVLAKLSSAQTAAIEGELAAKLGAGRIAQSSRAGMDARGNLVLGVEGLLPPLDGLGPWINSPPLNREQLRGKVVLIDFWTYSCINCIRSIPYVRAWHERYAADGLVVIGVHAPEFAFERNPENVRRAVAEQSIGYPVALDNRFALWRAMENRFWPAHYFIDARGRVRYHHFGEGEYAVSERVIRQLLTEAGRPPTRPPTRDLQLTGVEMAAAWAAIRSPETYLGYARAERFVSPGGMVKDREQDYRMVPLQLNQWALDGRWTVEKQSSRSASPGARLAYRFNARDVHLVLGGGDKPVRFKVTVDGAAPGADAGTDVAADGTGIVGSERLYQLVRQKGSVRERTFTIEFRDPGAEAFAFTFG